MSTRWIGASRSMAATVLLLGVLAVAADKPKLPPLGVVPDEPTAVKIAEAVFLPANKGNYLLD